jgi:hypothetical protein
LSTRIDDFRQVYTASLDSLTTAMQAGVFTKEQVKEILAARHVLEKILDDADAANARGGNIDAQFWLDQINTALNTYIHLAQPANATTRPSARPVGSPNAKENPWKLQHLSSASRNRLRNWLPSTRRMQTA